MKTFNFHLDTKVTTWYRTEFEIEATSLEKAQKLAIDFRERGDNTELPWEQIDDTQEGMTPDENGNQPTEELYDENGNIIWDNTEISIMTLEEAIKDIDIEKLQNDFDNEVNK